MAHVALHRLPGWGFVVVEKIEVALLMVAGPAAETVRGGIAERTHWWRWFNNNRTAICLQNET